MIKKYILFAFIGMIAISCKNEPKASTTDAPVANESTESNSEIGKLSTGTPNDLKMPNTCDFITKEWIVENFQVDDVHNLDIKSGKTADDNSNSSSCFYRWAWNDLPNAGFLFQIMTNPVQDEYPDWVSDFVETKRKSGSNGIENGTTFSFEDFPGFGTGGCYSKELKQYYWSLDNKYVFMLALNMDVNDATQLSSAKKLAGKFMEGFESAM